MTEDISLSISKLNFFGNKTSYEKKFSLHFDIKLLLIALAISLSILVIQTLE